MLESDYEHRVASREYRAAGTAAPELMITESR